MKVLDIAALSLNSDSKTEFNAIDLNKFSMTALTPEGNTVEFILIPGEFQLELSAGKRDFDAKLFTKWLSEFEYRLEQHFLKNFVIDTSETAKEYRIKIIF